MLLSTAIASTDLAPYRWKSRVLVLRTEDSTKLSVAREKLQAQSKELQERDVVILEERTGKEFRIELYGKDGGKKWQAGSDFRVKTILDLIDSMPMRQQETKN